MFFCTVLGVAHYIPWYFTHENLMEIINALYYCLSQNIKEVYVKKANNFTYILFYVQRKINAYFNESKNIIKKINFYIIFLEICELLTISYFAIPLLNHIL